MRRFWYAKYALTLLALTAVTFHLLHSGTDEGIEIDKETASPPAGLASTKGISSYLRRRLSQGIVAATPSGWTVLPGNVTVHRGDRGVPFDVSFLRAAEDACRDVDPAAKTLLIFVASSVDHFDRRRVIRDTWGLKLLQEAHNYRIVYLVGVGDGGDATQAKVARESFRYGDLVQIDQKESFRNLGRKSVAGLHWSKTFCPQADFVMKTDDDILVHVPNLIRALSDFDGADPLLMCHENRMRKILRRDLLDRAELPESYRKYEVSENELPGMFYPPYCSGMAYVFSRSVRDRLFDSSLTTPVFFIEDVYLTGFCRHKARIEIRPHAGITLRPPIRHRQSSCSFKEGRITSQEVSGDELRRLWAELNTQGFFCPQLLGLRNPK